MERDEHLWNVKFRATLREPSSKVRGGTEGGPRWPLQRGVVPDIVVIAIGTVQVTALNELVDNLQALN